MLCSPRQPLLAHNVAKIACAVARFERSLRAVVNGATTKLVVDDLEARTYIVAYQSDTLYMVERERGGGGGGGRAGGGGRVSE